MFFYLFNKYGGMMPLLGAVKALDLPTTFFTLQEFSIIVTNTIATASPRLPSPQGTPIYHEFKWKTPVYLNNDLAKTTFETTDLVKSPQELRLPIKYLFKTLKYNNNNPFLDVTTCNTERVSKFVLITVSPLCLSPDPPN